MWTDSGQTLYMDRPWTKFGYWFIFSQALNLLGCDIVTLSKLCPGSVPRHININKQVVPSWI